MKRIGVFVIALAASAAVAPPLLAPADLAASLGKRGVCWSASWIQRPARTCTLRAPCPRPAAAGAVLRLVPASCRRRLRSRRACRAPASRQRRTRSSVPRERKRPVPESPRAPAGRSGGWNWARCPCEKTAVPRLGRDRGAVPPVSTGAGCGWCSPSRARWSVSGFAGAPDSAMCEAPFEPPLIAAGSCEPSPAGHCKLAKQGSGRRQPPSTELHLQDFW